MAVITFGIYSIQVQQISVNHILLITAFDSSLIITSLYIMSKLKICEYYCSEFGNFQGYYRTSKEQTELIRICAKRYGEIIE